jgi:flagellar biosynthetic protein FlhB
MSGQSDDNKEFDATPRRKEQGRKEGQFARSRDAGGALALALLLGGVSLCTPFIAEALRSLFHTCWSSLALEVVQDPTQRLRASSLTLLGLTLPASLLCAVVGLGVGFLQSGIRFDWDLVAFKPERLNPMPRFQQWVTLKEPAFEASIALLRVVAIGGVSYRVLREHGAALLTLSRVPFRGAASALGAVALQVATPLSIALLAMAGVEYGLSWYRTNRSMRMSRKEIMDEQKSEDGDPKVKGRMRQRAKALARSRSLKGVKEATVVITNPTHVAVALRYSEKDAAPVVVAKGHDAIALQIRAEARRHRIPIIENRRLARAIDAAVPIGQPVPAEHFAAVAKVLAFVFQLRDGRRGQS